MPQQASQRGRRPSATRSESPAVKGSPPTLSRAHLQGFTAGCIVGIAATVGLMRAPSEAQDPVASPTPSAPSAAEAAAPHFDFYTVLPNEAFDPNPDIEPADLEPGIRVVRSTFCRRGLFGSNQMRIGVAGSWRY